MVALWRLGLGRWVNVWPHGSGRILVLGHTGRRTGRRRWTPLNYAEVDGELYCTAGFGSGSDWYRNVLTQPQVELWLPGRRTLARVHEVSDHPQRTTLLREVLLASGFAAGLAGVDPRATDARLAAATESYRLLRLQPVVGEVELPDHPRPGDWAWCWAVLAALAVVRVAAHRPRHQLDRTVAAAQ
jgi:deazaflavin-dependent oxidoreductase (nitroreductase family)